MNVFRKSDFFSGTCPIMLHCAVASDTTVAEEGRLVEMTPCAAASNTTVHCCSDPTWRSRNLTRQTGWTSDSCHPWGLGQDWPLPITAQYSALLQCTTVHHSTSPCTTVHHCAPQCTTVHHHAPPGTTVRLQWCAHCSTPRTL